MSVGSAKFRATHQTRVCDPSSAYVVYSIHVESGLLILISSSNLVTPELYLYCKKSNYFCSYINVIDYRGIKTNT